MSRSEILEQFSECWEGLDDPRSGNAVVHDFYELLLIALFLEDGERPAEP